MMVDIRGAGGWTTATIRAAVARRSCARDDGSTRQGHQRIARARAHLGEPTGGAGVDGVRRRRGCGGGRSSAPMETTTPCTGGATVSIYVFYQSSRTQRRFARDQMATGASSAMSLCGGVLSGKRGAAATAC